jgi:membrane-associated phospholipid phosphatase
MMIFTFRHWYVMITYSCWALLIMYSRMALGVHDMVDLVGGAVVASGSVLIVLITQHRFFTKQD